MLLNNKQTLQLLKYTNNSSIYQQIEEEKEEKLKIKSNPRNRSTTFSSNSQSFLLNKFHS